MTFLYQALARQHNWWSDTANAVSKIDIGLKSLVCCDGSLTAALKSLGPHRFAVRVLTQQVGLPYFHEQRALGRTLSLAAMIREVELSLDGVAVVFARSIIPLELMSNGTNGLAKLGSTPLGHLLFNDGRMRISRRQYTRCQVRANNINARRTPYDYQGSQILVSEFFLPAITQYATRS